MADEGQIACRRQSMDQQVLLRCAHADPDDRGSRRLGAPYGCQEFVRRRSHGKAAIHSDDLSTRPPGGDRRLSASRTSTSASVEVVATPEVATSTSITVCMKSGPYTRSALVTPAASPTRRPAFRPGVGCVLAEPFGYVRSLVGERQGVGVAQVDASAHTAVGDRGGQFGERIEVNAVRPERESSNRRDIETDATSSSEMDSVSATGCGDFLTMVTQRRYLALTIWRQWMAKSIAVGGRVGYVAARLLLISNISPAFTPTPRVT